MKYLCFFLAATFTIGACAANHLPAAPAATTPASSRADTNTLLQPDTNTGDVPLDKLAQVAIALDQGKQWGTAAEENELAMLTATGKERFNGLHKLLTDDFTGIIAIFSEHYHLAAESPWPQTQAAIKALRANGYASAADALTVLCVGYTPGDRILAWVRLPAEARKVIDGLMLKRYPADDTNRRQLILAAAELVNSPPPETNGMPTQQLLAFACWFDQQGSPHYLTFEMAQRWAQAGKKEAAFALIDSLLAEQPADPATLTRAVSLYRSLHAPARALAAYQHALAAAPEPLARDIRQGYFGFLLYLKQAKLALPDAPDLVDLQQQADQPLLAADALLTAGKNAAAAAQYRALLEKKTPSDPNASPPGAACWMPTPNTPCGSSRSTIYWISSIIQPLTSIRHWSAG